MTDFQVTQLVVGIGTLLTGLGAMVGILVALYRESRNRRWDQEDRVRIAQELADKTQAAADLVRAEALEEASAQRAHAVKLAEKLQADVERNTLLTEETKLAAKDAYSEANHANMKIAVLQQDLIETIKGNKSAKGE